MSVKKACCSHSDSITKSLLNKAKIDKGKIMPLEKPEKGKLCNGKA